MKSLLSPLTKAERRELLRDLNYLNMGEIKSFCTQHSIPFSIWVETKDKGCRKSGHDDRKGIILKRIRKYLNTSKVPPATVFSARVISFDKSLRPPKASDRLFYGQYDKTNRAQMDLLKVLTAGRFRNGAVARIVATDFWTRGIAPTYREYAAAWLRAQDAHKQPNEEWAFLSDRVRGTDTRNWKQMRRKKADRVLRILDRLSPR